MSGQGLGMSRRRKVAASSYLVRGWSVCLLGIECVRYPKFCIEADFVGVSAYPNLFYLPNWNKTAC